jgi:uncharacterized protein YebE (UPF0316 family)
MIEFWQNHGYAWIGLPLIIFLARILDVAISTLRLMFLARGSRVQASVIGFFEAFIWIIVISQVIRNLDNVMCYLAYASGFAMGTFVGMKIEERLALGKIIMRVITPDPSSAMLKELRAGGFAVTRVAAEGAKGSVQLLFMVLKRADMKRAVAMIHKNNPQAFYTVEDVRYAKEGVFPIPSDHEHPGMWPAWRWKRG